MTDQKASKKGRIFLILFIFILIPAIWFFFLNKNKDFEVASEVLPGKWLRYDGTYMIEILKVKADGTFNAAYFNPQSVNVGKADWRVKDEKLQVLVELRDVNYDGSNYKLTYDEKTDQLVGFYYQAVAKETYEVAFYKQ